MGRNAFLQSNHNHTTMPPTRRAAIHMPHTTCWTYASYHMHMHECCPSAIYPFILAHSHLGSLEQQPDDLFFKAPRHLWSVGLVHLAVHALAPPLSHTHDYYLSAMCPLYPRLHFTCHLESLGEDLSHPSFSKPRACHNSLVAIDWGLCISWPVAHSTDMQCCAVCVCERERA